MSRKDQKLEPQRDALLADDCERVFEEKISSRETERDGLRQAFDYCREGDVLIVARLDRLGRSLRELIDLVSELEGKGVGFRSLKESLDTTTTGRAPHLHVFGALAEFERETIRERTIRVGSARARGRHGGLAPARTIGRSRWPRGSCVTARRPSRRCAKWWGCRGRRSTGIWGPTASHGGRRGRGGAMKRLGRPAKLQGGGSRSSVT
ncbi:MAG: recombinase family protein [Actinomycetota bacterium]|nr:recombinase family protein [Actinomycetota bacterium]